MSPRRINASEGDKARKRASPEVTSPQIKRSSRLMKRYVPVAVTVTFEHSSETSDLMTREMCSTAAHNAGASPSVQREANDQLLPAARRTQS